MVSELLSCQRPFLAEQCNEFNCGRRRHSGRTGFVSKKDQTGEMFTKVDVLGA
jgi:hypothetical protein